MKPIFIVFTILILTSNLKAGTGSKVIQLVAGGDHTCVLTDKHEVKCWGYNGQGQINVPTSLKNSTQISAGEFHTCALTDDGVKCWGGDVSGITDVPSDLKNPSKISAGGKITCAISDNVVKCWGDKRFTEAPTEFVNPIQIATGSAVVVALTSQGKIDQRNDGYNGRNCPLCDKDFYTTLNNVEQIAAGGRYACAIANIKLYCWDVVNNHQISTHKIDTADQISIGSNGNLCAITEGKIVCFDDRRYSDFPQPPYDMIKNPIQVASGASHACALSGDSKVICWGSNEYGQSNPPPEFSF